MARKSFSKLRSSIAGLYESRNLFKYAEIAYKQSIELYDLSPEANFKLANLLAQQNRFDEGIQIISKLYEKDSKNESLAIFIKTLNLHKQRSLIERKFIENNITISEMFNLYTIYIDLNLRKQGDVIAQQIINNLNETDLYNFIEILYKTKNTNMANIAVTRYLDINLINPKKYVDIAYLQLIMNKKNDMYSTLTRYVNEMGNIAKEMIRNDVRFEKIRDELRYKQLLKNYFNKKSYSF